MNSNVNTSFYLNKNEYTCPFDWKEHYVVITRSR